MPHRRQLSRDETIARLSLEEIRADLVGWLGGLAKHGPKSRVEARYSDISDDNLSGKGRFEYRGIDVAGTAVYTLFEPFRLIVTPLANTILNHYMAIEGEETKLNVTGLHDLEYNENIHGYPEYTSGFPLRHASRVETRLEPGQLDDKMTVIVEGGYRTARYTDETIWDGVEFPIKQFEPEMFRVVKNMELI